MNTDLNEKLKQYQRNYYEEIKIRIFLQYKSKKTLKFGDIVVNKKEFHASKQAIDLSLVDIDKNSCV